MKKIESIAQMPLPRLLNKREELKINNEDKKATDKIDIVSLGGQRTPAVRVSYQPPNSNNKNNEISLPRDISEYLNISKIIE